MRLGDYWIPIIKVSIETRLFPPELYAISSHNFEFKDQRFAFIRTKRHSTKLTSNIYVIILNYNGLLKQKINREKILCNLYLNHNFLSIFYTQDNLIKIKFNI